LKQNFDQLAVFSATIVTSGAGVYSAAFSANEFGLGAAATFQVFAPQISTGSGTPSSYRLRLKTMLMEFTPFNGRSVSYGAGSGIAGVIDSQNVPSLTYNNIAAARKSKAVYNGKPYSLKWTPTANVDRLWVSSVAAQTAFFPVDATTVGATFMIYTSGGVATAILGTLLFKFRLEIEMY
jgi:hypothetical protein